MWSENKAQKSLDDERDLAAGEEKTQEMEGNQKCCYTRRKEKKELKL